MNISKVVVSPGKYKEVIQESDTEAKDKGKDTIINHGIYFMYWRKERAYGEKGKSVVPEKLKNFWSHATEKKVLET